MPEPYIHESSYVDTDVEIGAGTKVWHFSHIMRGTRIGKNCSLGQNVLVGPNAIVGNNVKIQNNVSVYEGVVLEDDVFCGPSCVFTNVDRPRSAHPTASEAYGQTIIRQGATIGANATIVCGHTIGAYAFIGAGAVVTCDLPDYAVAYGNPARIHGWICACGAALTFEGKGNEHCSTCGKTYMKSGDIVKLVASGP